MQKNRFETPTIAIYRLDVLHFFRHAPDLGTVGLRRSGCRSKSC